MPLLMADPIQRIPGFPVFTRMSIETMANLIIPIEIGILLSVTFPVPLSAIGLVEAVTPMFSSQCKITNASAQSNF
jgi:hypothetical protein